MAGRHVATSIMGIEFVGLSDFVQAFQKITKDSKIGVDSKSLHDEVKKAGKSFNDLLKKASSDAFGKDAKKRVAELGVVFRDSMQRTMGLQQKLTQTNLASEEKTRIKSQLAAENYRRKSLDDNLKRESKANAKWAARRKFTHSEIERVADRGSKNRLVSFAQGLANAYSELKSGKVSGVVGKGFGLGSKALSGGGKFVGGDAAKGGMGSAGTGRMLAGLGTMVGVVGGLAAAVGLLIKMFFDMDAQIKETNKSLIKAGGAYEFMGRTGSASVYDIGQNLEVVRKMAHDVTNNLKWMTMPKEQFKIIGALIEADYGFQKMTKGATTAEEQTRKLFDATSMVLNVSKQLGLENARVAKDMGTFMQDTGMGVNEMRDGFSKLIEVAKTSGFNMKRFYSTILESTSGLYYYNQRLGEAADLLKRLTGMLGTKAGTEFFKSIQKGFSEMGYKERFKQILTAGGKNRRQIFAAAAQQSADNFGETLAKNENVKNVLEGMGLTTTSGAGLAGQLAKMSDKQFSTFKARFGARFGEVGGQEAAGRQLRSLTTLRERQRGARGGLDAQSKAMGTFQGGTAMAMNMANFLGPIHELSAIELSAFEEFKGISGSQLETLRQLSSEFTGQFALLKDLKKLAQTKDFNDKENLALAKRAGYAVDENTKTIRKVQKIEGKEITFKGGPLDNLNQYIMGQGSAIQDAVGTLIPIDNQQLAMAKQVVANTEPLSKILSITIAGLLSDIREYVKPLEAAMLQVVSWLGSDDDGSGAWAKKQLATRGTKDKLMERADAEIKAAENRLEKVRDLGGDTSKHQKALEVARSRKAGIGGMGLEGRMEAAVEAGKKSGIDIEDALEAEENAILNEFTLGRKTATKIHEEQEKALKAQSAIDKKTVEEQIKAANLNRDAAIRAGDLNAANITESERQSTLDLIEGIDKSNQRQSKALELYNLDFRGDLYSAAEEIINAPKAEQDAIMLKLLARSRSSSEDDFIDIEGAMATATNDFILTNNGKLIKPSSQDAIFGMKPGGPIANAMGGGMGGGGGPNISVIINESHDPQKTYNVVKRVLQQAGVM